MYCATISCIAIWYHTQVSCQSVINVTLGTPTITSVSCHSVVNFSLSTPRQPGWSASPSNYSIPRTVPRILAYGRLAPRTLPLPRYTRVWLYDCALARSRIQQMSVIASFEKCARCGSVRVRTRLVRRIWSGVGG